MHVFVYFINLKKCLISSSSEILSIKLKKKNEIIFRTIQIKIIIIKKERKKKELQNKQIKLPLKYVLAARIL